MSKRNRGKQRQSFDLAGSYDNSSPSPSPRRSLQRGPSATAICPANGLCLGLEPRPQEQRRSILPIGRRSRRVKKGLELGSYFWPLRTTFRDDFRVEFAGCQIRSPPPAIEVFVLSSPRTPPEYPESSQDHSWGQGDWPRATLHPVSVKKREDVRAETCGR